jgi:rubrerythrin
MGDDRVPERLGAAQVLYDCPECGMTSLVTTPPEPQECPHCHAPVPERE